MKKLIIVSTILSLVVVLPAIAKPSPTSPATAPKKCEVSCCDPQYQQADTELNQVWKSLSEIERNALRPSQRNWIKTRDSQCGKDNQCLIRVTAQQTQYLKSVKDCTRNGGGLSCFEGKCYVNQQPKIIIKYF